MDPIEEWKAAQARVIGLVEHLDDETAAKKVPACPAWSVRQLLAHVVGLGADCLAGNVADDHNPDWTQAQVEARAEKTVAQLVDEWRGIGPDLCQWMAENGADPLGDVTIHEQDLRGALETPGARDTDAWFAIRDTVLGAFAKAVAPLPPIALIGEPFTWTSGDDADCLLIADDYDLARAVMGRRSAQQLRSWTERGDVTPYLDAFAMAGPLPETDLTE